MVNKYFDEAVALLQKLISTPSISKQEGAAADVWEQWLETHDCGEVKRFRNNVYALSDNFSDSKPILMLNSHLDTVKPVSSYTRDPFKPEIIDGKLYGLGSNDAGASGVSLAAAFRALKNREDLPFNLILAITAAEESMGEDGMRAFLPYLREAGLYPDMAIVGEPTSCNAAIAERGLVVCDVMVKGKAGHAAREEGINAIYRAIEDIESIRHMELPCSQVLGPVKVSVTMIEAGTQHNIVPEKCSYVADIRTVDTLSNEDTVKLLNESVKWSVFTPRSTRIRASVLSADNPLYITAKELGMDTYVSPTTSDMALMHDISSIKIGPGESSRSHTADEFIILEEIRNGIKLYVDFVLCLGRIVQSAKCKVQSFG